MTARERIDEFLFHLLLTAVFALLAWLSVIHVAHWDWTASGRNSLAPESLALLQRLQAPLLLTSYAPDNPELRRRVGTLLQRYRRAAPQRVQIAFVDPELEPERARAAGVELAGELVMSYLGRSERLRTLSEGHLSNTLQRLLGRPDRWIGALIGHGERKLDGRANHDLGRFGTLLEQRGYKVQALDLNRTGSIPRNLDLLVIAGPQADLPAAEAARLTEFVDAGGRLLWLLDPGPLHGLEPVADALALRPLPGQVVDANVRQLGVDDPTVALVSSYPDHRAVRGFETMTLFPQATALESVADGRWQATPLLRTLPRSWNETGPVSGEIRRDADLGEQAGPLTLGVALQRASAGPPDERGQRIAVIGDGDFLANSFLDNVGNRDLGLRLVRWLLEEDALLDLPSPPTPDHELSITPSMALYLGAGSLVAAPLGFVLIGVRVYRRRRKD